MPGILWLASFPKSGNTWMRAFLGNYLFDPPEPLPLARLSDFTIKDNFLFHYEAFTGRTRDELTPDEIRRLRPQIHAWFARSASETVIVKTHSAVKTIEGVQTITPSVTAGALYIVRNPLDVAVSFAHHTQIDCAEAVEMMCDSNMGLPANAGQLDQFLGSWSDHVRSWTRTPGWPVHVVRYEDLVNQPHEAFGAVARFLTLPEDPTRLNKAIAFSSFAELAGQERRDGFEEARPDGVSRFFRQGRIGAWREALGPEQVRRLIETHREDLVELGYLTPDGNLTF